MSGGSFNYVYIYFKEPSELFCRLTDFRALVEFARDYGPDGAYELLSEMNDLILETETKVAEKGKMLEGLGRALEWMASGDSNADYPKQEIQKIRQKKADKDADKPTYYFTQEGHERTYIEHAVFIDRNSFPDREDETHWIYPVLKSEDMGEYIKVTMEITHYERKKRFMSKNK